MKEEQKKCGNCKNFCRYYQKGRCGYTKTEMGVCQTTGKIRPYKSRCDAWENGAERAAARLDSSMRLLSDLLTEISAIRHTLEEQEEYREEESL